MTYARELSEIAAAITVDGSKNVTTVGSVTTPSLNSNNTFGFKNRILNGDMRIDQRNAGAAITLSGTDGFFADRWVGLESGGATVTAQRSTTAPSGFTNSGLITVTTATANTTSDFCWVEQRIEGFNGADLAWGTADAKAVTLSFRVRSSLTGTFGFVIRNTAGNRSYLAAYSISSANTFETKTITIPGCTDGVWETGSSTFARLIWDLGVGTSYTSSASSSWNTTSYFGVTGAQKLSQNTGATFYLTGVQLEVGTSSTAFDTRAYGTELALCQRYFENCSGMVHYCFMATSAASSAFKYSNLQWVVTKRATPTVSLTGSGTNATGFTANSPSVNQTGWYCNQTTTGSDAFLTAYSASAEL